MAKEYISHEVMMNALADKFKSRIGSSHVPTWNDAYDTVTHIPTADVVEVRHGRWIADKEDVEWGNYLIRYRCSECKERPHFDKDKYKFILSPYCPNCGAKMDGGHDE